MKYIFILTLVTAFAADVNAQTNNIFKRKPWDEAKLKSLLSDTLSKLNMLREFESTVHNSSIKAPDAMNSMSFQTKNGVHKIPLTGVFIGDNGRGDEIYAMQPDNMPCLVPGKSFSSNMPVAGRERFEKSDLPILKKGQEKGAGQE